MRLHVQHATVLWLLIACGDSTSDNDNGSIESATEHDGGAAGNGGGVAGSAGAGSRDASRPQGPTFDAGSGNGAPGDAGARQDSDARVNGGGRDGGRRGRDAAAPPPSPADAAVVDPSGLAQHCVDTINMYRATMNLPAYARAPDKEMCVDAEAQADSISGTAHGAFGMCKESAQNECPGWPTKDMQGSLDGCLKQMWAEGPGDFNMGHGHYINMISTKYKSVACGVHDMGNGKFWAAQDFF